MIPLVEVPIFLGSVNIVFSLITKAVLYNDLYFWRNKIAFLG